jgi:hypothetical protein
MTGKEIWNECKTWFAQYFVFLIIAAVSIASACLALKKSYTTDARVNNFSVILNSILESNIDSNKIDSLTKVITSLNLEQESYSEMLNRQSDWFIMYVTQLFFILGLFGFVVSNKAVSDVKKKNSKEYNRQKKVHADLIKELNELKYEVYTGLLRINLLNLKTTDDAEIEAGLLEFFDILENSRKIVVVNSSIDPNFEVLIKFLEFFETIPTAPKVAPVLKDFLTKNNSKNLENIMEIMEKMSFIKNKRVKTLCISIVSQINNVVKAD